MENKRDYIYDFLRVLSCFFIIGIHCCERFLHGENYNNIWWEYNILSAIFRSGLLLFVFISGALILNKNHENLSTFYLKRFIKIVVPLLIYSYIYLFINKYNFSVQMFIPKNMLNLLIEILAAPIYYHFWFVYMIIGLYIFAPFISKMVKSLTESECLRLTFLLYVVSFIRYFLPSFGIKIGITNIVFVEWMIPFLLGYLTTRKIIYDKFKLFFILGGLSFLFLIISKRFFSTINNIYDLAPTFLLQCQAIFLLFIIKKEKICHNNKINKIISYISNYTYGIYLIHAIVLDFLQKLIFNKTCIISSLFNNFAAIFLVFIISFSFSFLIDNLVKYCLLVPLYIKNYVYSKKYNY